jgi:hypothetical protein
MPMSSLVMVIKCHYCKVTVKCGRLAQRIHNRNHLENSQPSHSEQQPRLIRSFDLYREGIQSFYV